MDSVSDTGSDSSHLLQPQTEKEYGFQRPRQSFVKRHRRSLLWGSLSLLAVLVIVITYISTSIRSRRNSFVPSMPWGQVLFTPDERFSQGSMGPNSPWNDIMPLGKGFVKVPVDQQQGLGDTHVLKDGSGEYCLSVFHQIHCIGMLRDALNSFRTGKPMGHQLSEHGQDPLEHVDHCIDYLRQAVMCSGDMSLEHYNKNENGTIDPGVNGYFVNHQCKSWDHIMDFATKHRSRNVR